MTAFRRILIFTAFLILGLSSLPFIHINLLPQQQAVTISVSFSMKNALPLEVEQEATSVFENAFSRITGVKNIHSISRSGRGVIELEFDKHDLAAKKMEILSITRSIYPKLRDRISYPVITQSKQIDHRDLPILIYNVVGNTGLKNARQVCEEKVLPELRKLMDMDKVVLKGGNESQIEVSFFSEQLKKFKVSKQEIKYAIEQHANRLEIGKIKKGQLYYYVSLGESLSSISDIENIEIRNGLRIGDIAQTAVREVSPDQYLRINGNPSLSLAIYGRENINQIRLATNVKSLIKKFSDQKNIQLILSIDNTEFIKDELKKSIARSIIAVVVILLTVLIFKLDLYYSLIVLLGIVSTLSLTSVFVWILGINIHLYSIAGLTISLGLIIDNTIIILDSLINYHNIYSVIHDLFSASVRKRQLTGICRDYYGSTQLFYSYFIFLGAISIQCF